MLLFTNNLLSSHILNILLKNNSNIEIQSVLNSQCDLFIWEINHKELRVQFNAKQSSTTKLQSYP